MNNKLNLKKFEIREVKGSNKIEELVRPPPINLVRSIPLPNAETMKRPIPDKITTKPEPKGRPMTFDNGKLSDFALQNS